MYVAVALWDRAELPCGRPGFDPRCRRRVIHIRETHRSMRTTSPRNCIGVDIQVLIFEIAFLTPSFFASSEVTNLFLFINSWNSGFSKCMSLWRRGTVLTCHLVGPVSIPGVGIHYNACTLICNNFVLDYILFFDQSMCFVIKFDRDRTYYVKCCPVWCFLICR